MLGTWFYEMAMSLFRLVDMKSSTYIHGAQTKKA